MRVIVTYENHTLLLTVVFLLICHYYKAGKMDFEGGPWNIEKYYRSPWSTHKEDF